MHVRLKPRAVSTVWFYLFVFVHVAAAGPSSDACDLQKGLQSIVEGKYPETKIVSLSDLSEDDRQVLQKDHAGSSPGVMKVAFYGEVRPILALALTKHPKCQ